MKKRLRVFLSRLKTYLLHYLRTTPKTCRVVIFGQGRTGSTLLESLLDSTGHFNKNGELLGHNGVSVRYPYEYISGLSKRRKNSNFVFHLKIYHLTRDRKNKVNPTKFLNKLQADGWKFIYLQRTNKFKHSLSNLIAIERKGFHKFNKTKELLEFYININAFKKSIENRISLDQQEQEVLKEIKHFHITYELNLKDNTCHQKTISDILGYLKLSNARVFSNHVRINTYTPSNIIKNWDEVHNMLRVNDWLKHLDD